MLSLTDDGTFREHICLSRNIGENLFQALIRKNFGDAVSQTHPVEVPQ